MRTKDGREFANRMNVILIELPKVEKLLDSIETNTALENWAIYLSYADIPSKRGLIERLTEKEKGLMDAQVSLTTISENKEYWINQFRQETRERDIYSGLQAAEKKGRAEGISQGRLEERNLIYKKLLDSGMSEKEISEILGTD